MLKVQSYEVHETSDGQQFTALSVAKAVQARLNLVAALGQCEQLNVDRFISVLEANSEVILDFLNPERESK